MKTKDDNAPVFQALKNSDLTCSDCILKNDNDFHVLSCSAFDMKPGIVINGGECPKHLTIELAIGLYEQKVKKDKIKSLMLKAIEEKRPQEIADKCLPIWNQPFFYRIDEAKALTISYAPTDKGAKKNYTELYEGYKKGILP